MIAVGIDVSKGKSTVAILNGDGSMRAHPYEMNHSKAELDALIKYIKAVDDQPIILMEPTSHYHYPLLKAFIDAGLSPSLVNPYLLKKYGDAELRKTKTDKKDALRIARYALRNGTHWFLILHWIRNMKICVFCLHSTVNGSLWSLKARYS